MSGGAPYSWHSLFSGKPGAPFIALRTLKKDGGDFLVLPLEARLAVRSLSLYPAQTSLARIARKIFSLALLCKLPLPLEMTRVRIKPDAPFEGFLTRLTGSANFPAIAILCGNVRTAGRRFVLLVFDEAGNPAVVVKAGLGTDAEELIEREIAFLNTAPAGIPAIPKVRNALESDGIRCLALDFVDGVSPPDSWPLGEVLTAWLHKGAAIPIESFPVWRKLALNCASQPVFNWTADRLAGRLIRPAIQHGDFAPWNIKLSRDGSCTVLDWERGEVRGLPAWDWFHYVIQTGILVGRLSMDQLICRVDAMLSSSSFKEYARHAEIEGCTEELLLAYLLYCVGILKPADSFESTRALLEALWDRVKK